MYEHLHLLEWQLRQSPDPIARLLAKDALVDLERPSALELGLARAWSLVAGLALRRDRAAQRDGAGRRDGAAGRAVSLPARQRERVRGDLSAEPQRPAHAA